MAVSDYSKVAVSASSSRLSAGKAQASSSSALPVDPLSTQKQYAASMKALVSDWQFKASIRKKIVPLNKYGLPGAAGDAMRDTDAIAKRAALLTSTKKKLIAGWDDGTGFDSVIDLFSFLLDLMCSFVGKTHSERMRKALDIDMLRQMVKAHVYSPEEFNSTVGVCVELMHELESPYQDEITQKWYKALTFNYESKEDFADAIVNALMFLIGKCDVCKIEVENYYISRVPVGELSTIERAAFKKIPLALYKPWDCSTKSLFVRGLLAAMADSATALGEKDVPNTLALDLPTLHKFQNALQETTILAIMSAVFNNFFATWHPDTVAEYMDSVLKAYESAGPHVFLDLLLPYIAESEVPRAAECCEQLIKCANVNNPLYKVFRDRAVAFLVAEEAGEHPMGSKPVHMSHSNAHAQVLRDALHYFVGTHWEVYEPIYTQ